jgi:cobalt-zinc-cadmium efflux system outer membrane protein
MGSKNPAWHTVWIGAAALIAGHAHSALAAPASPPDSLTLAQALERGRSHPALAALRLEVDARKAGAEQAGSWANPRLSLEAENFAGTGPLSGARALETTARLEQTVELGDKRALRKTQAEAEAHLSAGDFSARQRDVARAIREAFIDALWLQEKARAADRKVTVLDTAAQLAKRRTETGRGSPAEEMKMRVEQSLARLEAERAAGEAASVKMRLSVLLDMDASNFPGVRGDLEHLEPLPPWDSLSRGLERSPAITRWKAEKDLRLASQKLMRSENMPDLDFNAGLRQQRESGRGDYAWVGGVSMPLPLWNRNRAGIRGASLRVSSLDKEEQAVRQELQMRARALSDGLRLRTSEIERLRVELIPEAERASAAARAAYAAGRFSSLELLDGQRLSFELKERYLAALAAHHHDAAELQALAGSANISEPEESP